MKIYCETKQFPTLTFCSPHPNPHGAKGLSKHYHLRFVPKIGHGICAILLIPCAFIGCTLMLYKTWNSGIPSKKQARYQPVIDCTYWSVLCSFNNWNIIHVSPKSTTFEAFEEIHQVVIDWISNNLDSLVQSVNYSAINTADTTKNGFYVIMFICP